MCRSSRSLRIAIEIAGFFSLVASLKSPESKCINDIDVRDKNDYMIAVNTPIDPLPRARYFQYSAAGSLNKLCMQATRSSNWSYFACCPRNRLIRIHSNKVGPSSGILKSYYEAPISHQLTVVAILVAVG